ncbi:MAG: prolyl oligopeptidase family serine peptidase [Pirellulales bacterium]
MLLLRVIRLAAVVLLIVAGVVVSTTAAQEYGEPDRDSPGDAMIQAYLRREAAKLDAQFADDFKSREAWEAKRKQYVDEYYYMLGLDPRPEKTPLRPVITGSQKYDNIVVENLHYQSRPGLYVTGNLYRPATVAKGEKLPAVFYVCGHSGRGRDGNKVAYQSHGIWFARHGYVCLIVDSLQLGEIAATHHGTYRYDRWWWHSRGYTPAGVEAWNGVRGIDYLVGRDDVDPKRIAVTGISGGGAATYWIAAADERVAVAVPVSGMADLDAYVGNRVINGHCDCMFLYNTFRWPWTRIAGLIAPRPMLFVNSDNDGIFPMDANARISNRLERLYSLYGAGDRFDSVVSVGGHAYRQDIRQAAFGFINAHLKGDARRVTDSEIDIVSEGNAPGKYPFAPEELRVFPTDGDLPRDELNTKIDETFVPMAQVAPPKPGKFDEWKKPLVAELKRVSFGHLPDEIPPARKLGEADDGGERLTSEEGIEFRLRYSLAAECGSVLLVVLGEGEAGTSPDWAEELATAGQAIVYCEPRGIGATRWTKKNPPNYVERSHVLLGRTVDSGRVWDVAAAARYLAAMPQPRDPDAKLRVDIAGRGGAGLIAAYAALLTDVVKAVTVVEPPTTHMDNAAPRLLNVLRVCDVPAALGLIAPRPLIITGEDKKFADTAAAYAAAGAADQLLITPETHSDK